MVILAHRGLWYAEPERNSLAALQSAFTAGFGIETDIRDYCGKLVVSHDVATKESILLMEVLKAYQRSGSNMPLGLNIKADGIQRLLQAELEQYEINNYFVFDMSIPEQVLYLKQNFHTFGRQSEFERTVVQYEQVEGIWMDEFATEWITAGIIREHLSKGKQIGVISSEIHGNGPQRLWSILEPFKESGQLMLCTDIPQKAKEYFYG